MFCIRWFFIVLLASRLAGAAEPDAARVIILANSDDPDSVKLAEYYANRRSVPVDNIIALKLPLTESVGWHEFVRTLFQPLQDELVKRGWVDGVAMNASDSLGRRKYAMSGHRISYLVVCRGVPLRVIADGDMPVETSSPNINPAMHTQTAAVDSELALLAQSQTPLIAFVPNPLYRNDAPTALDLGLVVKVGRLDGPTLEDARRLIDQAITVEKNGLIGRSYVDIGGPHPSGDMWLEETAKQLAALGFDGDVDRSAGTFATWARFDAPALYFGWYAGSVNGPFTMPDFMFPPGAIALHIHSFSADTVRSSLRNWVGPLVARGVTATFGNVTEPYLEFTHRPQLILKSLARGDTLGDAAAYSIPVYSWQGIVIGDPLYRPFKVSFDEQWKRLGELPSELRPYVVLRRMRQVDKAGRRNEAIWAGMEAQKAGPSVAVALGIADLQQEAGDISGPRMALDAVIMRRSFTLAEAPMAAIVAQRLMSSGEHSLALAVWQRVLGNRSLPDEVRIEWLRPALAAARSAKNVNQAARWLEELETLLPPQEIKKDGPVGPSSIR